MTTPAKNIDYSVLGGAGQETVYSLKPLLPTPVVNPVGATTVGWFRDQRPQSGNAPMADGFRLCRGWNHAGRNITLASSGGSWTAYYQNGSILRREVAAAYWQGSPPELVMPSGNMINATTVKALNKLKDQDLHLGNFFAEADKTVAMVGNTAISIARGVTSFRRRFPRDWELVRRYETGRVPRSRWCLIPDKWLELQYGWIPLMSDLYGGLNHLSRRSRFKLPFVRVSAQTRDTVETVSGCTGRVGDIWKANCTFETEQKVTVVMYYKITGPKLAELSSLGLINPVEIVWELVPYSFVVDWFLPIGPWMSALTAAAGMSFLMGSTSRKARMRFTGSSFSQTPNALHVDGGPGLPSFGGYANEFVRTCMTQSPVPGLYVKSPISLRHALNGLALLAQAFR